MTSRERYLKYKTRVEKWKKENPEKTHAIQVAYRRRKGQVPRKQFLSQQWKKEKNPNWRGGNVFRTNKEEWRRLAFQIKVRDKFECRVCGRDRYQKMRLVVHHIIPYDISKNDHPSNLITLCQLCHLKIHQFLRKEGKQIFV